MTLFSNYFPPSMFCSQILHLQALWEAACTQSKAVEVAGARAAEEGVWWASWRARQSAHKHQRAGLRQETTSQRQSVGPDQVWRKRKDPHLVWRERLRGPLSWCVHTHTRAGQGGFLLRLTGGKPAERQERGLQGTRQLVVEMECLGRYEIHLWGFWGLAALKSPNVQTT